MFNEKRKFIPPVAEKAVQKGTTSSSGNSFVNMASTRANKSARSAEGSVKYHTTTDPFLDDFNGASNYKMNLRSYDEVAKTMHSLYAENPELCVAMALYMRIVPRVTRLAISEGKTTEKPQIGAGLKHESLYRWMWLAINHREVFEKNFTLYLSAGAWKDFFNMLRLDLSYNSWDKRQLDWNFFSEVLKMGICDKFEVDHIRQYMPLQKAAKKVKTLEEEVNNTIAKWICSELYGSKGTTSSGYAQLRDFKNKGKIHAWQKLISQKKFKELDFKKIPGRARNLLVKSKFLSNQNLSEAYTNWLNTKGVTTQNYTGYAHELFKGLIDRDRIIRYTSENHKRTVQEQFMGLVEAAKPNVQPGFNGWFSVIDISGSMMSMSTDKLNAYSIAHIIALFMRHLFDESAFAKIYAVFHSVATIRNWAGSTIHDELQTALSADDYVGGTKLDTVANLMVSMLRKGAKEQDFPSGIVCYSDGMFHSSGMGTEFENFRSIMLRGGFSKEYVKSLKIVLWNIPNNHYGKTEGKFEVVKDTENCFLFSGFNPQGLALLTTGKMNSHTPVAAKDLMLMALDQELMTYIQV